MESLLQQGSSFAQDIDFLIILVAVLGGFWFLVAEFVFFVLIFKFRKKKSPSSQYVTGEKHHETKWITRAHWAIILCDIAIVIFSVKVWYNVKQQLPEPEQTIRIVAQQWAWQFTHPAPGEELGSERDVVKVDELHVKVNTLYHFKLESTDVLHDFSVPVFRLKQDAVPGRVITGWFKPTRTGEFDIQCAEMCGIGHGIMGAKLVVHSAEDYNAWFAQEESRSGPSFVALNAR